MTSTQMKRITLHSSGVSVLYRDQRPSEAAKVLLILHGFPSSSHQYRNLIPLLASRYHVIAPDLPGFGFTEVPSTIKYTFGALTDAIAEFLDTLYISKVSLYIFDYGAPVGLRLALLRLQAIESIISQNSNASLNGFGDVWGPVQDFWASENTQGDRAKLSKTMLNFDITKFQYENGTPTTKSTAPESYHLDYALLERPGNKSIQLDLFMDYQTNVGLYDRFQEYFRASQVPMLAL